MCQVAEGHHCVLSIVQSVPAVAAPRATSLWPSHALGGHVHPRRETVRRLDEGDSFLLQHNCLQRLDGRIEDVTTGDLSKMEQDHFLLILNNLKEKAVKLQSEIENTKELNDPEVERTRLNSLQKELITVMPMMSLVRTLVKMESIYRGNAVEGVPVSSKPGGLNKAKQAEVRVSQPH